MFWWNIVVLYFRISSIHFLSVCNSALSAVSSGAVRSLSVVVSLPRRHQPLWPQDHLPGVASHSPHHCGCGLQGGRSVPVGLWGSQQEDLHSGGEILPAVLVFCFCFFFKPLKWSAACSTVVDFYTVPSARSLVLTNFPLVLCLDGSRRLGYRHEV